MSKISATTPTKGLKDFESTKSNIMSTVSAINKKFEPISWNRKKVPSARIMKRKIILKSLIVKYLGQKRAEELFRSTDEVRSVASTVS